ncbi:MAG TPA: NAD-binding protein [Bacteroidia bacterium]|jgi:flavin-dependent dehydrogenase|nr:NAD-binding protein [Bacteroidia bacterium]
MNNHVGIIGGGIAGLALSIDLRKRGYPVTVIEKGEYPRHKVCGEYISMESHRYLLSLCPALSAHELPRINQFLFTAGSSKAISTSLSSGGFGISRYLLEEMLFVEAQKQGVLFMLGTKARKVYPDPDSMGYVILTDKGKVVASLVCNSSGRQSNMHTGLSKGEKPKTNYVGVKYHLRLSRKLGQIEIHNFPGGYCGISDIEDGKSCLCYIVNSEKLKAANNSIREMERIFLFRNPKLKEIFSKAEFVFKEPLTISGIQFQSKVPVSDNIFYLGDSAGSIAPITGNGMSMGLRSAFMLGNSIEEYFNEAICLYQLAGTYSSFWKKEFSGRIERSRHLQKLSESPFLAKRAIGLFRIFPSLFRTVIKQTHGQAF